MKKLIWIVTLLVAIGVLGFVSPWVVRARAAQPLIGVFDRQDRCE